MNLQRSWRSVLDPPPQGTHRGSNRSRAPQSRRRAGDGIRILASMPCPVSSSIDMAPEYRAQLLAFFMNAYMSPSPEHSQMVKANMILELPDQLGRTCILDQAIVALCSVFVGIVRKDASLQQYGGSMYGAAMQDLRIHIQHAEQPSDSVLYAIAVLQVYEVSCLRFSAYTAADLFAALSAFHDSSAGLGNARPWIQSPHAAMLQQCPPGYMHEALLSSSPAILGEYSPRFKMSAPILTGMK